jgi:DNA-binding response OmpR family regulator
MTTILVVDDEFAVRSLLHDVLELEGYTVREAEDGPSALLDMTRTHPDLVILDVMMPRMSGIEVLTEIRSDPELHALPVIMLTAAGDDDTTWAGWTAGASTYLNKPFDHDNLLTWVERLLVTDPEFAATA